MTNPDPRLIELDGFPFEFLSHLAERESWRKEVHRPVYHVHKWWAKRLGSVFRGILLGCTLPSESSDLTEAFYESHSLGGVSVFDPFMGSGTTIGEAHKLGMTALGRDINPVAVEAVRTALGRLDRDKIVAAFDALLDGVGKRILSLYRSIDTQGRECDVLYYFWVMQASCPDCKKSIDLFSSHVIARNAYPDRKPEIKIRCPACGDIFPGMTGAESVQCPKCRHQFDAMKAPATGAKADCSACNARFGILSAVGNERPVFRLYAKLVLNRDGRKEYIPATDQDLAAYQECSRLLRQELEGGSISVPSLRLAHGHNTKQAISYNFKAWSDFFNDRQLLALGWLRNAIENVDDLGARSALRTLFSGALEFNNLFASYKGEGTGAVRHMFAHHILKPERTPIEANVWGTPKSSGAFANLFRTRLLRAIDYRNAPMEIIGKTSPGRVCSDTFSGKVEPEWPKREPLRGRRIYLSQGDSAHCGLPTGSVDIVVTDPPFFDNVHYSELADFFYAWQQTGNDSTRSVGDVQDADPDRFSAKLQAVFAECHRVLSDIGLFVFTYHHSRNEGWYSLIQAIRCAGFAVVNTHPVKGEMSVATPKAQAKEPIQLDIVIVCRKRSIFTECKRPSVQSAVASGRVKLARLQDSGFTLSRNDRKVVLFGQLLTAIDEPSELESAALLIEEETLCTS